MSDRSVLLALAALYEVANQATYGPIQPSLALRALLAMLFGHSNRDRAPYESFWSIIRADDGPGPSPGYQRATMARTAWACIVRTLGMEPQAMELHEAIGELISRQREVVDPAWAGQMAVERKLREAVYDREIISTKGRPYSAEGRRLMAERIARGEDPA